MSYITQRCFVVIAGIWGKEGLESTCGLSNPVPTTIDSLAILNIDINHHDGGFITVGKDAIIKERSLASMPIVDMNECG